MGYKMCVDHPATHKYTIAYLARSVSWEAGVKYIDMYLGKSNLLSKKQRDITLHVGCAKRALQKG